MVHPQRPFDRTVEWEAQTTQKEQNSSIAWSGTQDEVGTSGEVRFLEAGQPGRTWVEVQINYSDPPGSKIGENVFRTIAHPKLQLEQYLRNLKTFWRVRPAPRTSSGYHGPRAVWYCYHLRGWPLGLRGGPALDLAAPPPR